MPTDPAGNYTLPPVYFAQPGTTIRAEQHNAPLEDIAQGVSGRLMRDGRNGMVGALDMGGFPIRNVQPGQSPTDAATVGQGVPVGSVMDYAGANAPEGWLLCYGQAVSRTTYAALFAVIGTTYGSGNGSTTFNVPDYRGRASAGLDNMGGTAANRITSALHGITGATLGSAGGSEVVTLTTTQMPTHTHTGTALSGGAHTHTLTRPFGTNNNGTGATRDWTGSQGVIESSTDSGGAHTHTLSIANEGGGGAHNNVQPTIIMNKIMKAAY